MMTKEKLDGIFARLREVHSKGKKEQAKLNQLQTLFGWNYHPLCWLVDPYLNVNIIDAMMWDWMHCYFISGIWTKEVRWERASPNGAFLEILGRVGQVREGPPPGELQRERDFLPSDLLPR